MKHSPEHYEQVAFVNWCRLVGVRKYPHLDKIFAIANGSKRHVVVAVKLKAEGVRAGVSDLFIPVPMHGKHGLWIEMKANGGTVTCLQKKFQDEMNALGYVAVVTHGWEDAVDAVKDYYEGKARMGG